LFFSKRKLQKYIIDSYGSKPEVTYFAGDIDLIKNYYNYKKDSSEKFLIDDITWNDLNMDEIFKKINRGVSTAGEQYLYYQLRNCTSTQNEFEERSNLINYLNEEARLKKYSLKDDILNNNEHNLFYKHCLLQFGSNMTWASFKFNYKDWIINNL